MSVRFSVSQYPVIDVGAVSQAESHQAGRFHSADPCSPQELSPSVGIFDNGQSE